MPYRGGKSRGSRGFFYLQVDRRDPVIVDVMSLAAVLPNPKS